MAIEKTRGWKEPRGCRMISGRIGAQNRVKGNRYFDDKNNVFLKDVVPSLKGKQVMVQEVNRRLLKRKWRSIPVLFFILVLSLSTATGCAPLFSTVIGDRDCLIYALELQARTPEGIPSKLLYAEGKGWAHYWLWLQVGNMVYIHDRDGSRQFGPLPDIDPFTLASWAVAPHRVEKAGYVVHDRLVKK